MQLWELFVIAVGLSMDAFAVSICKGLSVQRLRWSHALTAGAWFGAFQALMPLAGCWAPDSRGSSPMWTTGWPLCCWS